MKEKALLSFREQMIKIAAGIYIFLCPTLKAAYDGGIAGSFLLNPVGARGSAIGQAFNSFSDDSTSLYWNPAGLSLIFKPEFYLSRTWLIEGTEHSFLGFSYPVGKATAIGTGYILQSSKGYEKRINAFDPSSNFSISNAAFLLGMGSKIDIWELPFSAGFSLKRVGHKIDTYSDTDFGIDAGIKIGPVKDFTFAGTFNNLLKPQILLLSRKISYSQGTTLTAAYDWHINENFQLINGIALSKYEDRDYKFSLGLEISHNNSSFLRLGKTENGFSTGFGFKSGNYKLDYAAIFHEISTLHTVSLTTRFGMTSHELEEMIKKGITKFDKESASRLAKIYIQQAEIYYKEKRYLQAINTMENVLLLEPYNAEVTERIKFFKQEMDKNFIKQMIEKNQIIALEYFEHSDLVTSRQYWQSILEIEPDNAQAKEYIDKIDKKLTDMEKEQIKIKIQLEQTMKITTLINEASALLKEEKYSQAISKAKKILTISPENKEAQSIISIAENGIKLSVEKRLKEALSLCEKKQLNEALKIIETVLKDSPGNKEAIQGANLCRAAGLPEPTPEEKKIIEQNYYMAVDYYLKGKYKEAMQRISEIYKIDPFNENTRNLEEKIKKVIKEE